MQRISDKGSFGHLGGLCSHCLGSGDYFATVWLVERSLWGCSYLFSIKDNELIIQQFKLDLWSTVCASDITIALCTRSGIRFAIFNVLSSHVQCVTEIYKNSNKKCMQENLEKPFSGNQVWKSKWKAVKYFKPLIYYQTTQ